MFGGRNIPLADALDGEKTQDFVNVLKRKQNNMKPPTNSIKRKPFVSAFTTKTYILCQSTKTKGQSLKTLQRARLSVI